MTGHHLVLGTLRDCITGEELEDTHDERYRQKLGRLLIGGKAYPLSEVEPRVALRVRVGDKAAIVPIDFRIGPPGRPMMIVKYGPGSITTRHRCAAAAALLVAPYRVPICVVTNGEDADILESRTGKVLARGLGGIPSRSDLLLRLADWVPEPVTARQQEMASRILYAYEVDGKCPCDDTVCIL